MDSTDQPAFGFSDLEDKLAGDDRMAVLNEALAKLAGLDQRMAEREKTSLTREEAEHVASIRKSTAAGVKILLAEPSKSGE